MPQDSKTNETQPNRLLVAEEAASLLTNKDFFNNIEKFKPDTPEKEIALEFVSSYSQFMLEIVQNDLKKQLVRSDMEVKDLIAHVNMMMKEKDSYIFSSMVLNSAEHYKQGMKHIQKQKMDADKKKGDK